ncbi:MAG: tryptophan synthase subunit alpha [Desulfomonile tiedjei]|nr:tryptophan synthase subunit alpha [Desulfomonile tiedjei]
MERIERTFKQLRTKNETGFIPFSIAGYPDAERSLEIFLQLARSGADVIEFGFPFSDPIADGPVIQKASTEAIRNGMNMDRALNMIAEIRSSTDVPIVFFSYFNPIHNYGTERFVARAKECGLDGVLVVDLPMEEAGWLKPLTDKAKLAWIYLATPTSPVERVEAMDEDGSGFLYYVSVTGVTGARNALPEDLAATCADIRRSCRLPLAVGFGVSNPRQASWLRPHVDGVVVGSAIISRISDGASITDLDRWLREMKAELA